MDAKVNEKEIYIEPITDCNLKCKLCYANVVNGENARFINKKDIINFVDKFLKYKNSNIKIYWCGAGEIFLHREFPSIIKYFNLTIPDKIEHTIMTNGTIDRLNEFDTLTNINFRVSIDGPKEHHEWNRGLGTYDKSINFCKKVLKLGCKNLEIRTIVTKDNVFILPHFEQDLFKKIKKKIELQLIFPYSSVDIQRINSLSIKKNIEEEANAKIIPMNELMGIVQSRYGNRYNNLEHASDIVLSTCVMCNGIFSCCEGIFKIGNLNSEMEFIEQNLINSKLKCKSCRLFEKC